MKRCKINMDRVAGWEGSLPPHMALVRKIVRDSNGTPVIARSEPGFHFIRTWEGDLLGDVCVPEMSATILEEAS